MDIDLIRRKKYVTQKGQCYKCHKDMAYDMTQLAHVVPKSKLNIKKYGADVIHHPYNLKLVCSLECNQSVLVKPGGLFEKDLMQTIKMKLKESLC